MEDTLNFWKPFSILPGQDLPLLRECYVPPRKGEAPQEERVSQVDWPPLNWGVHCLFPKKGGSKDTEYFSTWGTTPHWGCGNKGPLKCVNLALCGLFFGPFRA